MKDQSFCKFKGENYWNNNFPQNPGPQNCWDDATLSGQSNF